MNKFSWIWPASSLLLLIAFKGGWKPDYLLSKSFMLTLVAVFFFSLVLVFSTSLLFELESLFLVFGEEMLVLLFLLAWEDDLLLLLLESWLEDDDD